MNVAQMALRVHRRRLDSAERALAKALDLERHCAAERERCEERWQIAKQQALRQEQRLWDEAIGRPCTMADFEQIHAEVAHLKAGVRALQDDLAVAQRTLDEAHGHVTEARRSHRAQAVRTEKFEVWSDAEHARAACAELQRQDDAQDDVCRQRPPAMQVLETAR